MMFSSLLYFHPVLKATPTPTHSGLMQKICCEGYTHKKCFDYKDPCITSPCDGLTAQATFLEPAEGP